MSNTLKFKKMRDNAILPTRAHPSDSGLDMYATHDAVLRPMQSVLMPLGVAVQLPEGFEGQIRPRSSQSKDCILVYLGTIDQGYRGEIMCKIQNLGEELVRIKEGDRVAQFIVSISLRQVPEWTEELTPSDRGEKAFGSSGK